MSENPSARSNSSATWAGTPQRFGSFFILSRVVSGGGSAAATCGCRPSSPAAPAKAERVRKSRRRQSSDVDGIMAISVSRVALLYHLVRPRQHRRRDRQPKRFGGHQIDDQLELGWLLDGKIGGLGASEDLVGVPCRVLENIGVVGRVREEAACFGIVGQFEDA